jgi:uncharacterized protein YeaO (DUF488 family)
MLTGAFEETHYTSSAQNHSLINNRESTVSVRIVRLGTPRHAAEGLRIGTVRRPPRGVPRSEFSRRDLYDVWLPNLAPSEALLKQGMSVVDERGWKRFARAYRKEMQTPAAKHLVETLAALSRQTNFSVGCYCADATRCHRSVLQAVLEEHGAAIES